MNLESLRAAAGEFPWLESLPEEFQDRIWRLEWERHTKYIETYAMEFEAHYQDEIAELETQLADRSVQEYDLIDNFFPDDLDDEDEETEESEELDPELEEDVNPYTGEEIIRRTSRSDEDYADTAEKAQLLIGRYREILADREALTRYRWELHWQSLRDTTYGDDDSIEWDTVSEYVSGDEYENLFDSYHRFFGRDPEDQRERERYLQAWDEANLAAASGGSSLLEELSRPSEAALIAQGEGKRLTREYGDCYVCKKFVKAQNGELLLWNEIPKSVREEFIPGVYKKWHVRHLHQPCSSEEYGKRIPLTHVSEVTDYRNQKAEACWMCGKDVSEGEGWLVHYSKIPKWKQAKPAFPGAKIKKYYVQCNKGD